MKDSAPETPPTATCMVCRQDSPAPVSGSAALCDSCRLASVQKTRKLSQTIAFDQEASSLTAPVYRVGKGDLLAQRFLVSRFLGSGGMGEVFEARDLVLNDRVALKIVHGHGGHIQNMSRLRREVQLARQVTHNNVCRIFDLIQHRDEVTDDTLDLVSMELLKGETLRDLCDRRGRLSLQECLPIVRQVARGLSAAHRLGIIHRDLKPCNVMLVDEEEGQRAAITDFGLAHRFQGTEGAEESGAFSGELVGTPAYIAPEQVADEPTSPATDVYSFGIMFYEMLSGRLPFSAETPWLMLAQRMSVDPTPLKVQCPDLDPAILDLVDCCLKRHSENRFQSMGTILEQLDFGDNTWNVYGHKERSRPDSTSVEVVTPQEIAVLPESIPVTESASPTRKGAAWTLGLGLAAAVFLLAFFAFPREKSFSKPVDGLAASEVGQGLTRSAAESGRGTATGAEDLSKLLESMGIMATDASFHAAPTRTPEEALAVSKPMLAAYESEDTVRALGASLVSNPTDPQLLTVLATARWRQGRAQQARSAIVSARQHGQGLGRRDRRLIEGIYEGLHGNWERGRQHFKEAWRLNPGDLKSGLWIIEATWLLGQSDPLTELFTKLRDASSDDLSQLRIDLWQSRISGTSGDFAGQERLALKVIEGAERLNHPFLVLEGWMTLADALGQKHEPFEYRQAVETFGRLAEVSEEPLYLVHAQQLQGHLVLRLGRHEEAASELAEADAAYAELGSLYGRCLVSKISGAIRRQPLDKKMEWLERGGRYCERGGFEGLHAFSLYLQARTWRDHGDFDRAMPLFRQSSDRMRGLDDQYQIGRIHISLGNLLSRLGRAREAIETLEQVGDLGAQSSDREMRLMYLITTSNLMIRVGRMEEAGALFAMAEALEPAGTLALDLVELRCVIALEQGDAQALAQAASAFEGMARNLVDRYRLESARGYHALSLLLQGRYPESLEILKALDPEDHGRSLAEVYFRLGDLENAAAALEKGLVLPHELGFQSTLWMGEILSARIEAAEDTERSIARLQSVEQKTGKTGSRLVSLEATLARGQITQDESLLRHVHEAAREHGFLRIASEADAEMRRLRVQL